MRLRQLFTSLIAYFAQRADPDVWWPIYRARTDPPAFERVITNVLVQNSSWGPVRGAIEALDSAGFLTAATLAEASRQSLIACIKTTGLAEKRKAPLLNAIGACVIRQFGTEREFCSRVTRDKLLAIQGIGQETADRTLLYACGRLAWPVDTYCKRVLCHYGLIPPAAEKMKAEEKRRLEKTIKAMVEDEMPHCLDDWQRLHALMQLTGESLRRGYDPLQAGDPDKPAKI